MGSNCKGWAGGIGVNLGMGRFPVGCYAVAKPSTRGVKDLRPGSVELIGDKGWKVSGF